MARIDYDKARELLASGLRTAEKAFVDGAEPAVNQFLIPDTNLVFSSATQAYREVLLGCLLVRIADKDADMRLPYVSQGPKAFPGRDLDERVINPFLQENQIPGSKGPYLNVFRRQVKFDAGTRDGLRDKAGYDAFLRILDHLEAERSDQRLRDLLIYLLYRFVLLREESNIPLARIHRLSLRQYGSLIERLLQTPSGGLLPVLVVASMLRAIKDTFELDWAIDCQDINVSDRSARAGGDITVSRGGSVLMAVEVTERAVDEARVVSTFRTKIAPAGIADYIFLVNLELIEDAAIRQADHYFAQGHEMNFVDIRGWILNSLVTIGQSGRASFNERLQEALSAGATPQQVKAAWNSAIGAITSV